MRTPQLFIIAELNNNIRPENIWHEGVFQAIPLEYKFFCLFEFCFSYAAWPVDRSSPTRV